VKNPKVDLITAMGIRQQFGRPPTLNTEECAAVLERLARGINITELAREFKTTRQTIT